jgi:hypothetical protein
LCQLAHLRKGSVAKALSDYLPEEQARMPVLVQRSTGGCTQVLTVLTMHGVRRLCTSSRSQAAKLALQEVLDRVDQIIKNPDLIKHYDPNTPLHYQNTQNQLQVQMQGGQFGQPQPQQHLQPQADHFRSYSYSQSPSPVLPHTLHGFISANDSPQPHYSSSSFASSHFPVSAAHQQDYSQYLTHDSFGNSKFAYNAAAAQPAPLYPQPQTQGFNAANALNKPSYPFISNHSQASASAIPQHSNSYLINSLPVGVPQGHSPPQSHHQLNVNVLQQYLHVLLQQQQQNANATQMAQSQQIGLPNPSQSLKWPAANPPPAAPGNRLDFQDPQQMHLIRQVLSKLNQQMQ